MCSSLFNRYVVLSARAIAKGVVATATLVVASWGVSPDVWRTTAFDEFAEGESERIAITHPGEIRLSPSFQEYANFRESVVWSLVEADDGKTLYAGTGNKAQIYKVASNAKDVTAEPELFANLEGNAVYAMLLHPSGDLFAGVSPGGMVYRIAPDGSVKLVGDAKEKYIWGMAFDKSGDLILATGDQGKILRMTLEGETKTVAETKEKHILSFLKKGEGEFYFGTAPGGWVGVIDDNNDLRVLYDSELSETKALVVDQNGTLYAGIVPDIKVDPPRDVPNPSGSSGSKVDKSSELVRVAPDGFARVLVKTNDAAINCLYSDGDSIVVGTGDEGKIFHLGYRENLDLVSDLEPSEVLVFAKRKSGGAWIATGNPARLFVLPLGTNKGGVYAAKPLDAGAISRWGSMTWNASVPKGATLDFQTRSGNTAEPDDNWSDWSEPIKEATSVESPPARYLQWRARFGGTEKGASAIVNEMEIVHQTMNYPPTIETVQVGEEASSSGSSSDSSSKSSNSSNKKSKKKTAGSSSKINLQWKAEDQNDDTLVYDLHYRRIGESLWKEIKKDLAETKYEWNLEGLPDGEYEIQLTASDRKSNPEQTAEEDSWISEKFRVDKTAPEVTEWRAKNAGGGSYEAVARVKDETSRLVEATLILDGDEEKARPLLPSDDILDNKEEEFHIRLEALEAGEHSLTLRVTDEEGNVGAGSLLIEIP